MSTVSTLLLLAALAAQATEVDPDAAPRQALRGLGTVVAGPFDVETAANDNRCLGVEEAWGHYWVTGRGHTSIGDVYMIHKYTHAGVYVASYPQNVSAANLGGWGGRDMEADDAANTLWVGNDNGYVEVMDHDPVTGGLVYNSTVITQVGATVRALCRNSASGNFFCKDFGGDLFEFDMATGFLVNIFTLTTVSAYGLAYDAAKNTLWATDSGTMLVEIDPATGLETGVGFGTVLGGAPGGADFYQDPRNPNSASLVVLHQIAPDRIVVYDTIGPPGGLNWTVNRPTSFVPGAAYADGFESYGGVLPPHMARTAVNPATGYPDAEAWCVIDGGSGLGAASGTACLEMGLLPTSNNYHDVRNALVLGLNGAGWTTMTLDFQAKDYGEEAQSIDGVWVSDDGLSWTQVYSDWGALPNGSWALVSGLDLSSAGPSTQGDFYLMFAQEDNYPYGNLDGVGVDEILVTGSGATTPGLSVSNLVAGQVVTISVDRATPGGRVRHGYSLRGGGPVSTVYGDLLLSPPYVELPFMTADAAGHASFAAPVPPGTSGRAVWLHAMDLGSLTFTNGVAATIG
jgi:hypothetical protein